MATVIKTFKVDKQEYKVLEHEPFGLIRTKWYSVLTPENAFGYTDTFLLAYTTSGEPYVYPLHRWHPKRVHNACLKHLVKVTILENAKQLNERQ